MDTEQREHMLSQLNTLMTRRMSTNENLEKLIKEFSDRLFSAFERVLDELSTFGVPGIGRSRRLVHPAGGGYEGFQLFIDDWSIIFVPLRGFARPHAGDEARIPSVQFKEPCGRIAVFLNDDPKGEAFYDFILFGDRSWFAWGYGWPRQHDDIEHTDFDSLALELILSFVKDIFVTWHPRRETTLADALDTKRRPYLFGLPGDEQQGGK